MSNTTSALSQTFGLDALPQLPQVSCLTRIVSRLWDRDDAVALWLGGSFARGEADAYSDLDLRMAVAAEALDAWRSTDLSMATGESVAGGSTLQWDGSILHHLVLSDGIILDLLVQSVERNPPQDFTVVLGCRDAVFGALLAQAQLPPPDAFEPAAPEAIRQAVIDFWVGSHKHAKMLYRDLDLVALIGLGMEQALLMRLWYVLATGRDQGTQRATIHTLTPTVRTVMESTKGRVLETLGAARGDRSGIMRSIETNRDEVGRAGRLLAQRLGFEYCDALERTVRESWLQFQASNSGGAALKEHA